MKANLELYKIFCVVANCSSFSQAARELYISQSAVSQAMNQLEMQLGVKLLIRSRKGVLLNEQGRALNAFASQALGLLGAGEERIIALNDNMFGKLRIGAGETICKHLLIGKLKEYRKKYHKAEIYLINRNTQKTIELIKQGRVELGFVNIGEQDEALVFQKIATAHDVFVASEEFIARSMKADPTNKIYAIDEIAQMKLIMLEKTNAVRQYIDEYASQRGIVFRPGLELANTEMLLDFAKAGFGVACMAREYCAKELASGELVQLKHDMQIPERAVFMAWLKDISISVAAERFAALLQACER